MSWKECEKNFIRKVSIDNEQIEALKEKALLRLNRARRTELLEENISFIVEDYYEVIKELLIAYMLSNGMRSKNHQCLISFFYKQNTHLDSEIMIISQMSFFRNRLEYYGETVPKEFYTKNKDNFEAIIKLILNQF